MTPLSLLLVVFALPSATTDSWDDFRAVAVRVHGEPGARAAAFLAEHRPERDRQLPSALLVENLALALRARGEFAWGRAIPEDVFLNDVLPYAVLDETREPWRPEMYEIAREIVADCKTPGEAAQALNRELFKRVGVAYHTGRKQPNQSPGESIAQGRASCTGLSILLVDACRAVGVPARVAGVASWNKKRGNHTWVEVWDGSWRFTGAAEYDAAGLDRAWFTGDAAHAVPGDLRHAVWASSWRTTDHHFPMVWNREARDVPAVDATARYVPADATDDAPARAVRHLRAWDRPGGTRIAAVVRVLDGGGREVASALTHSGTADLNDMPRIDLDPGVDYRLEVSHGATRRSTALRTGAGAATMDLHWSELGLEKDAAERLVAERWRTRAAAIARERQDELDAKTISSGAEKLRFLERRFGEAPEGNRSLWISLHGGGGAPPEVNDRQWQNQIGLYEPKEGYYVAPRAPTDTWDLWHRAPVDRLFDRLIETFVAARGVDPDRVYVLGYSAGGDGVYQLAPRIADRFAAAAMMAGHPNEASPLGLRNLPFAIFMGGRDGAYKRNEVAAEWGKKLAALAEDNPGGYPHRVTIYPEHGHWMKGEDREALPWMASRTRTAWPKRVVWFQDDVVHTRFYWLAVAPEDAVRGRSIRGEIDGQTVRIETADYRRVQLRLRDGLLDLDQPVTVTANGAVVFQGRVERTEAAIDASLAARGDPVTAATAALHVAW